MGRRGRSDAFLLGVLTAAVAFLLVRAFVPAAFAPGAPRGSGPGSAQLPGSREGADGGVELARQAAEEVEAVRAAQIIVAGDTVVVGLDLEPGLDEAQAAQVEREVARRIRARAAAGGRVVVTADPDVAREIERLRARGPAGAAGERFLDELMERLPEPSRP